MKKQYKSPTFSKTMYISIENISKSIDITPFNSPTYPIFSNQVDGVIFTDPQYDDCSCMKCFAGEMCVQECSTGC